MVLDLGDKDTAVDYLIEKGYRNAIISFSFIPRLSYVDGTGDGSWERIAIDFGWIREEPGSCCFDLIRKKAARTWCPKCGVGVNGIATWSRGDPHWYIISQLEEDFKKVF